MKSPYFARSPFANIGMSFEVQGEVQGVALSEGGKKIQMNGTRLKTKQRDVFLIRNKEGKEVAIHLCSGGKEIQMEVRGSQEAVVGGEPVVKFIVYRCLLDQGGCGARFQSNEL